MTNKNQQVNYKALLGAGIAFLGAGIVFMITVHPAVGAGLTVVGIMFIAIGVRKKKE